MKKTHFLPLPVRARLKHANIVLRALLPGWRYWYDEELYADWRIQKHSVRSLWRLLDDQQKKS